MFMTSLVTRSTVDPDLFPLHTIRSCISEAEESANGPRFCAQDNLTGCAYEVRCVKLQLSRPSADLAKKDVAKLKKQQERIDAIMAASSSCHAPPSVALPIDVYIQEQTSSGAPFVAAVDAFAGLSLADIVRSGWRLIEEHVFFEILHSVEQFGCAAASLPPHGNLSADAVKQLLTVRDGAAEAEHRSRWVVGDWLLLHDDANEAFDAQTFVADVEWVLHSAFSQLNVASTSEGACLSRTRVESAINDTVERIREHLLHGDASASVPTKASSSGDERTEKTARRLSVVSAEEEVTATGVSSSADMGSVVGTSPTAAVRPVIDTHPNASPKPSATASPPRLDPSSQSPSRDVTDLVRDLSLRDKIAFHQAELRREQQLATKYRRRNAPLPPLPAPPPNLGNKQDYEAAESAEYEMQYLTSPIRPRPSRLLSEPPPPDIALPQRARSTPPTRSSRKRAAAAAAAEAFVTVGNGSPKTDRQRHGTKAAAELYQPHQHHSTGDSGTQAAPISRELLLGNVISLALITQSAKEEQARRAREEERVRREALRVAFARSAALEAHRQQRSASAHARTSASGTAEERHGAAASRGRDMAAAFAFVPGSAFPLQQQHQHQQKQQQNAGGNRRRLSPSDAPLSSSLHAQNSTLNSGLGTSTLIQVSHSEPSPAPAVPNERSTPRRVPARVPAAAASRLASPPAGGTQSDPPTVEPLPLAALLSARARASRTTPGPARTTRDIPPQHSVRGSPRTTRPAPVASREPLRRSPRGAYLGPKAATSRLSPRGQTGRSPRDAPQAPRTGAPQTPQPTPRSRPHTPPPPAAPPTRKASSTVATTLHASSAHPHGLAAVGSSPRGNNQAAAAAVSGVAASATATNGSAAAVRSGPQRLQRKGAAVAGGVPPGRPAAADRTGHDGRKPQDRDTMRGVWMESPPVIVAPLRAVHQQQQHTLEKESQPISPRSPRSARPTHDDPAKKTTDPPSRGRAAPQQSDAPRRHSPSTAKTGNRAMRTAEGSPRKEQPRTVSPVAKKRNIQPVHEASIGITNRRARAGARDVW